MSEHAVTGRPMAPARASRSSGEPRRPAGPLSALAVAGACVVAMTAVWAVAELVPAAQAKDAVALYRFTTLSRPGVDSVANFLLHLMEPSLFVLWAVAVVATALARERPRVAVAAAAVLALAPLSADKLKPLLAHEHDAVNGIHIGAASWPSGHSTAAASLALCAVLVAPARLRPLVAAVGALFVLAVGGALLVLQWHMPSDVLGGYLLAAMWAALAVAGLRLAERLRPSRRQAPAPA